MELYTVILTDRTHTAERNAERPTMLYHMCLASGPIAAFLEVGLVFARYYNLIGDKLSGYKAVMCFRGAEPFGHEAAPESVCLSVDEYIARFV